MGMDEVAQLKVRVRALETQVQELLVRTGNLPARWALPGPSARPTPVMVTEVPSKGRQKYKGKLIKYFEIGDPPHLETTLQSGSDEIEFYNVLEAYTGSTFLVGPGDEVDVWRHGEVLVCSEIPRGFV